MDVPSFRCLHVVLTSLRPSRDVESARACPRSSSWTNSRGFDTVKIDREKRLRTMWNVFRSFSLPLVLSSMNATGRTLFPVRETARQGDPLLWCVLFPSLPRVSLDAEMEEANCPDELKRMLQHSRPLFAWYCLEFLERNACPRPMTLDYLDGMVTHVATEITSVKSRSELGQFDLLLCASLTLTSTRPTLIDTHFAQLDDEDPLSLSIDAKDNLYVDNVPWKCRCVFPSADRDVLLHLSLTTGRGFQTLKSPLHKMMEVPANREGMYWPDVDTKTDDGMALEPLVSAAMVLASHKGGLGGVAFPAFLGGFLYQLGVTRTDEPMELPGTAGVVVPFLSAPNVEWPLWLLEDWQSLGTLLATSIGQIAKTALTSGLNLT